MTEIGGYFSLSLPDFGTDFPATLKYQSARAALRAVLEHVKADTLWLPAYVCDAVVHAVIDAGAQPQFYSLDRHFFPRDLPEPCRGSYLLYVNHFGLNGHNVHRLQSLWPQRELLIDNSQALFAPSGGALATIYSPRKFLGLPDGGLLHAPSLEMDEPKIMDAESITRMRALLIRSAYSARAGYADYLDAERSLEQTEPRAMSQITRRLLSSVDVDLVKVRRRENFAFLDEKLGRYGLLAHKLETDAVPLCYPLLLAGCDVQNIKAKMAARSIFIPTYWPEVSTRVDQGSFESDLFHNCVCLPCDQRYGLSEMMEMVAALEIFLNEGN